MQTARRSDVHISKCKAVCRQREKVINWKVKMHLYEDNWSIQEGKRSEGPAIMTRLEEMGLLDS